MATPGTGTYIVMAAPEVAEGVYEPRSLENPHLNLSDPEAWAEIFGDQIGTEAGVAVNWKTALTYSPVWQAIRLLSSSAAQLPLEVFRRTEDTGHRGREVDKLHPAYMRVRRMANPCMAAFTFWGRIMFHLLLWNRAFAVIDRTNNGKIQGLYPLLPDRTRPVPVTGGRMFASEIAGTIEYFHDVDILFFEGLSFSVDEPCETLQAARNSFALGLAAEKFTSRFFKNGAQAGGILEVPTSMTKKAADKLEEGFKNKYTGLDSAFRTVILREGAKFHNTQVEPQKAQTQELRSEQVREVARRFNLPPHMLNDTSRSNYNTLEQENRRYLDYSLSPWLTTITSQCWAKLLTSAEQESDSHYFEHNTAALLAADIRTTVDVLVTGIQWGVFSANEARAKLNMNPRPGGDEFLTPLNMAQTGDTPAGDGTSSEADRSIRTAVCESLTAAAERGMRSVGATLVTAARKKRSSRFASWASESAVDMSKRFVSHIGSHAALVSEVFGCDSADFCERLSALTVMALLRSCSAAAVDGSQDLLASIENEVQLCLGTLSQTVSQVLEDIENETGQ